MESHIMIMTQANQEQYFVIESFYTVHIWTHSSRADKKLMNIAMNQILNETFTKLSVTPRLTQTNIL